MEAQDPPVMEFLSGNELSILQWVHILAMGPNAPQEVALKREIGMAPIAACIYWITIASVCFLGAVKPF